MTISIRDNRFELGSIWNLGDYLREKSDLDYIEKQIFYKVQYNKTHTKRKRKLRRRKRTKL